MDTIYRTSTGQKVLYFILAAILLGFGVFFVTFTPAKGESAWKYLFVAAFFAGGILVILNQIKRQLTISDTAITYANVFKTVTIPFDQIGGYRIGEKVITIESNLPSATKILINDYISLEDSDSIKDWLQTNFKDLDEADLINSRDALLHDAKLGYSEENRKRKMVIAKLIANV